jgi:nucleotide-binding universal stress UspA family protein
VRADAHPTNTEETAMSESIVVGTDGSGTAKRAVAEAVRLAKALGAEVHVVCAHDPMRGIAAAGASGFVVIPTEDDDEAVAATLADAQASAGEDGVAVHTHAVRATPADALVAVAAETGASLIVVGNQGMHGAKRVLGSVPNSVSHKARCNVLIVSTDQH